MSVQRRARLWEASLWEAEVLWPSAPGQGCCSTMITASDLELNLLAKFHIVFCCWGINFPSLSRLHCPKGAAAGLPQQHGFEAVKYLMELSGE